MQSQGGVLRQWPAPGAARGGVDGVIVSRWATLVKRKIPRFKRISPHADPGRAGGSAIIRITFTTFPRGQTEYACFR